MKLIHRSGSVRCYYKTISSYWGCTNPAYGETLMTIITDANKKAILPPAEDLKAFKTPGHFDNKEQFYSLPEYHHNSTELVFGNLVNLLSFFCQSFVEKPRDADMVRTRLDGPRRGRQQR